MASGSSPRSRSRRATWRKSSVPPSRSTCCSAFRSSGASASPRSTSSSPSFHQNPTESLSYTHHLTMPSAYVRHPSPSHVPTPVMLHVHPNHHPVTQRVRAHLIPDIYWENIFWWKTGNFFGGKTGGVHVNALARPHRLVLSHPPAAHSAPLAEPQRRSPRTCPASTFSHGSQHPAAARTHEGDSPRLSTRAV